MAIIRWRENPFSELERFQREINHLLFPRLWGRGNGEDVLSGCWSPTVDVYEEDQNVVLTADLPGLDRKEVEVSVENDRLIISGERKFENEEKEDNYHRIERCYGSFSRSFALNNTLDAEHIDAKMDKGVLTITIPKKEEAKPRLIEVQVK